jgi:chromosome partitioning protein
MKTVALLSQKGGAGKTTLAVCMAVAAERAGHSAVVLDLDPQATACNWSDRRESDTPVITDVQPARLNAALTRAEQEGVNIAFLDTPPRSEHAALEAAKAADLVLLPVRPQIYDLETLKATQQLITMAGDKPAVVVLNAVPARGSRARQAEDAVHAMDLPVAEARFGNRAAYGDAAALGLTPAEYEPSGKAAQEMLHVYMYISRLLDNTTSPRGDHGKAEAQSGERTG